MRRAPSLTSTAVHHHRATLITAVAALCALAVAGCGGGGNESGPAESLQASPASVTVMGSATSCFKGTGPTVFIYGGKPPYKVSNTAPQAMSIDKNALANAGDGVVLSFNGGCLQSLPIVFEDADGRLLDVTVTNSLGQ